jgi:hypothetical protein
MKGHPKQTKTFSTKKHGSNAERMAAKWVNQMWQNNVPSGCYRLNEISDTEEENDHEDQVKKESSDE